MPFPSVTSVTNIRLFIAFRILFNARFYYPVFTILFLDYGLTIEQFALLNTVWAITIVLAEVPSGALADVIGRKKLIIATSLLMVIEMAVIAFVPLGNTTLIFWAFLANRVLSGLAEAMASGADEAIAYDSLSEHGLEDKWPAVLSLQMRMKAIAGIITATVGALIYDPALINKVLGWLQLSTQVSQQDSMRYPIYLTLLLGFAATAVSMMFIEKQANNSEQSDGAIRNMLAALTMTLRAGKWIIRSPFALAVIICTMYFDHILRMLVTMTSQYFRLIHIPEASFGIISAVLSLVGIYIPKLCEWLVQRHTPLFNILILLGISLVGLFGVAGFFPYLGLLPMACVFAAIMMVSFFSSHYLNRVTDSEKRATVLSFKGMALNLGYGLIGILFAVLMQQLRGHNSTLHPSWTTEIIEEQSFIAAVGWFPWYTLGLFLVIILFLKKHIQLSKEFSTKG